jgi:hypothetical protein
MKTKLYANIQIDVDNIWCYLSDLGISDNSSIEVIYQESITRLLDLFDEFNIKATFFCIGNDALNPKVVPFLKRIVNNGHEVANHSLSHPQNFVQLNFKETKKEIEKSNSILEEASISNICGFKSPGWGINNYALDILTNLNYKYDSSIMPSYFLPMLSIGRFILSGGVTTNKKFGNFSNSLKPLKPYPINKQVWEVPNSVIPIIRTPFHSTFIYLLGVNYFKFGIDLIKFSNLPLTYVFHAIDLLPESIDKRLLRFPAMKKTLSERYMIIRTILKQINQDFNVLKTEDFLNKFYK